MSHSRNYWDQWSSAFKNYDFSQMANDQANLMSAMNPMSWMDKGTLSSMQKSILETQLAYLQDCTNMVSSFLEHLEDQDQKDNE